jgi:tetratricopeptide (TPR) repeat protein
MSLAKARITDGGAISAASVSRYQNLETCLMPKRLLTAAVVLAAATGALSHASLAAMDEPAPRPAIDCADPANAGKPACAPQHGDTMGATTSAMTDDQIYEKAYWSAKSGAYADALAFAAQAQNADDPRILRVKGFATRKMGDAEAAMPFYLKALSIDPADTRTRQYMGEAYLSQGDFPNARVQLREIEKRCGVSCEDYQKLADAIAEMHVRLPRGG